MTTLDQRFADAMGQLLGPDFPSDIGLAVSGGGDSMAMLYLAHNWTRVWGVRLHVCTVDHGFRPEAADEARMVADECATLGWPHSTLTWRWNGQGNKMEAARLGRLEAINNWRGEIGHVLLAHTKDDVAETFLMRLARGSGVEGLSVMRAKRRVPQGFEVVRPCLDMGRDELRHYLRVLQGPWVEDPSNEDWAYDRARVRALLPQLQEIGLTVDRLAGTAGRMARAKVALQEAAVTAWDSIGAEGRLNDVPLGDVQFGCDGFAAQPQDTQLRLLAGALCYVSGQPNRPRSEPLEALLERLLSGGGGTLHGCEVTSEKQIFRVFREYAALAPSIDPGCPGVWDGRWHVSGLGVGRTVGPLGEDGWALVPAAAKAGLPFKLARSLPCSRGAPGEPLVCPAFGVLAKGQTLEGQAAAPTGNLAVEHEEFDYRPMGKPGLTFREFLLSH